MNTYITLLLRILIILIGIISLFGQIVIVPFIAYGIADDAQLSYLGAPYTVLGIIAIACVQVALLSVWVLLSLVHREVIFTAKAFRWVNAIIGAGAIATLISIGLTFHIYFVLEPPLDAPGLIVLSGGFAACGMAFVLLMVVMRQLLQRATALKSEMDEVV